LLKTRAQPTATANQYQLSAELPQDYLNGSAGGSCLKGPHEHKNSLPQPNDRLAKARIMFKDGWQFYIVDADGRIFHLEQFDEI
jgi:hypothetical protein